MTKTNKQQTYISKICKLMIPMGIKCGGIDKRYGCLKSQIFTMTPEELEYRRNLLEQIAVDPGALRNANPVLRGNKEFMLRAGSIDNRAISFATPELKESYDFVYEVSRRMDAFEDNPALQGDQHYMLGYFKVCRSFYSASPELFNNRDFILRAVFYDGLALGKASSALRSDRDFVLQAMQQNPEAFRHTAEALQEDANWIESVLKLCPAVIEYISEEVKQRLADRIHAGLSVNAKLGVQGIPKTVARFL